MSPAMSIASSGALAQTQRLGLSAENVANARTVGALSGPDGVVAPGQSPYQPREAVQTAVAGSEGQGMGTRVVARPSNPGYFPEYQPDSPMADADGMVAAPAVDFARERVEQTLSLRAYQASLLVLRAEDERERQVMNLLA